MADSNQMFDQVDVNSDGEISLDELRAHLLAIGYTEEAASAVFRSLDANGDGALSRDELQQGFLKYEMLREAMTAVVTTLVQQKRWSPKQV
eukprot:3429108-Prymnesium_polylepis.1